LWALGCIIYECITGSTLFSSTINNFELEESICEAKFKFPSDFPPHAKDLIKNLLKKNPLKRLGAGPKGSENSMGKLRRHPFFKKLNFGKLHKKKHPVDICDIESTISQKKDIINDLRV